jgi:hypothetical protein
LEKVKSPLSMNFGRISTSKCRGKLQKMRVHPFSQKPWLIFQTSKNSFFIYFLIQKIWDSLTGTSVDLRPAGDHWSLAGPGPPTCGRRPAVGAQSPCSHFSRIFFFLPSTFCASGQLSLSLVVAHACPAQTSP